MFEIIPNWHPIFVHFTVALFSLSVVMFIVTPYMKPPLQWQWQVVARWTLWFGAGITVVTGLTGLYAYNTVDHDTASHVAMTIHRNWAIATITLFLTLAVWSCVRIRRQRPLGVVFVVAMAIGGMLLGSTAWRGGEAVYRYGLGVMSLPKPEGEGHAHQHADGEEHGKSAGSAAGMPDISSESHAEADGHSHDAANAHDEPALKELDSNKDNAPSKHNDDGHKH